MIDRQQAIVGLARNCVDSLRHALRHFDSSLATDDSFHDSKWAILSVAHAAEAYSNVLLHLLDPQHPKGRYPALERAVKLLQLDKNVHRLFVSERLVIDECFSLLVNQRDILMHRPAPSALEHSDAAVALLALLFLVRLRRTTFSAALLEVDLQLQQEVLDEIRFHEQDRWFDLAEHLAAEEWEVPFLEGCNSCGRSTFVVDDGCQACFAETNEGR